MPPSLTLRPVHGGVQQNPGREVRRDLRQHRLGPRRRRRRRRKPFAVAGGNLLLPRRRHVHDAEGRHPAFGAGLYSLIPVELDEVQTRL